MSRLLRFDTGLPAIVALVLLGAPAAAQPPSTDFRDLPGRVRVGETVWVAGEDGVQQRGTLWRLSASSLEIRSGGQIRTFTEEAVNAVWARQPDSLTNGAVIGLGIGVALAALVATGCHDEYVACLVGAGTAYGGLGSAIGVGVDAITPGAKIDVYRRRAIASARVSVQPIVAPRVQGVALRIAF
jgi:hypothetical protein